MKYFLYLIVHSCPKIPHEFKSTLATPVRKVFTQRGVLRQREKYHYDHLSVISTQNVWQGIALVLCYRQDIA